MKTDSPTWYDENIEEPVREVVRLLRDNGFNTDCSCGHEMYVQCNYTLEGELQRLHRLLFIYFETKLNRRAEYEIDLRIKVNEGYIVVHSLDVKFPKGCQKEEK